MKIRHTAPPASLIISAMGHDHHFLGRLDRVESGDVEFALSLYRDADLVRYILNVARIPDAAERVAISLDHATEGPFVLVARDGGFVTCLGRGMSPRPHPVITREHLEAMSAKLSDLRSRIGAALRWAGPNGQCENLIRRVYTAGPNLSREEFTALSAFHPILGRRFFRSYIGVVSSLNTARDRVVKIERPRPRDHDLLRAYYDEYYAAQHLSLLCSMEGPSILEGLPDDVRASLCERFSWGMTRQGLAAGALRGAWAVARLGKEMLVPYKRRYLASETVLSALDAGFGLILLALRHTRLCSEVLKTLASERVTVPQGDEVVPYLPDLRRVLAKQAELMFASPEKFVHATTLIGQQVWSKYQEGLPAECAFRYEREEDIPERLARTMLLQIEADIVNDFDVLEKVLMWLPYVARMNAEDFYYPQDVLTVTRRSWAPEATLLLLAPVRLHYGKRVPFERKPQPGRNDPCPCQSGRKFKKCCGAIQSSQ